MEQKYWLGRKRASKAMAWQATSSEARLIHLHLAGCYSVKAATCHDAVPLFAPGPGPMPLEPALHAKGEGR